MSSRGPSGLFLLVFLVSVFLDPSLSRPRRNLSSLAVLFQFAAGAVSLHHPPIIVCFTMQIILPLLIDSRVGLLPPLPFSSFL